MTNHRDDDLRALQRVTARDVPSLAHTAARARAKERSSLKEAWMSVVSTARRRPLIAGALGVVAIAIALLVVPVSYQRTAGYSVQVSAHVPNGDAAVVQNLSARLAAALHATNVNVNVAGGDQVAFVADVPMRARTTVSAEANAFAHELSRKGYAARAVVTPRVERVSGTVYAYAADAANEIRVNATGKSDAEIASDITSQLQSLGYSSPNVEVTSDGDQRQIKVMLTKTAESTDGTAPTPPPMDPPSITVTDDNKPSTSTSEQHRVQLQLTHDEIEGKSDAEIKSYVEEKLRAQGVNATVEVKDGKVVNLQVNK